MIYLKKANLEDAEKEYELAQKIPAEENGYKNKAYGVSFEEFVSKTIPEWINKDKGIGLKDGYVLDVYYFLWVDDTPVGIFKLRHCLDSQIINRIGHVGYGIAKEYRGHGYATEGLRLIIEEARKLPIELNELYLCAFKDNAASLKVQMKNGAKIVREDDEHYFTSIPL